MQFVFNQLNQLMRRRFLNKVLYKHDKLCPAAVAILNFRSAKKPTKLCRGLSPHHSQQISVQLVNRFQKRSLKFQPIRTHNWPWRPCFKFDPQKKQTLQTPTQGIFLPSLVPNGPMVSEEKIEMLTTDDDGRQVMAIAQVR